MHCDNDALLVGGEQENRATALAWFGVQAIVNLGGVTGLMPVTGLTLPFFSAGGSSLFVSMTAAGLLLSVARRVGSTGDGTGSSPQRSGSRRAKPLHAESKGRRS